MQTNLAERIALVTGASSGLGSHFAKVLAANGALVVLAARRLDRLKELRAEIESQGGEASVVQIDVTDIDSIAAAVNHVESEVGPIDILINNSGVSTTQRLTEVAPVDFDFTFNTNTRGAFFVAQEVAKRMIARSKQAQDFRARIVNVASVGGLRPLSQIGVYCMSKAAVVMMTRAQALEWGRYGINVNALCPGYIRTEINEDYWDTDGGRKLIQVLPRRRVGLPEDLDTALLMLVADESQFINGAILSADDGLSVT
jgi:NAD(P)-dependent dehydrogenase (short-subunit alcohol dehydrogenase family)